MALMMCLEGCIFGELQGGTFLLYRFMFSAMPLHGYFHLTGLLEESIKK